MKFETQAVIKEIGPIESFGDGGFQKRNLILTEQNGEYENVVCVEWSGDKLERPESHQVGQMVLVSGFINCREWNGKYFTSLKGSFIQNVDPQQAPQPAPQSNFGQPPQQPIQQIATASEIVQQTQQ